VPVLLYKLYSARTILNTIIQSLTPHNSMLNMSTPWVEIETCNRVKHSVTRFDFDLFIVIGKSFCIILSNFVVIGLSAAKL